MVETTGSVRRLREAYGVKYENAVPMIEATQRSSTFLFLPKSGGLPESRAATSFNATDPALHAWAVIASRCLIALSACTF